MRVRVSTRVLRLTVSVVWVTNVHTYPDDKVAHQKRIYFWPGQNQKNQLDMKSSALHTEPELRERKDQLPY